MNTRHLILKIAIALQLSVVLFVGIYAVGQQTSLGTQARMKQSQQPQKVVPVDISSAFVLETTHTAKDEGYALEEIQTTMSSKSPSQELPSTGQWHGRKITLVPNDRFFTETNVFTYYGINSLLETTSKQLIAGGLLGFLIKQPSDEHWTNLSLFQVPESFDQSGNVFDTIIDLSSGPQRSDNIILKGNSGVVRKTAHALHKIVDPTHLRGNMIVHDVVAYKQDAIVGHLTTRLTYVKGDLLKKWSTPRLDPLFQDSIQTIFNHPDGTLYAIIDHCTAPTPGNGVCLSPERRGYYLFKIEFSDAPDPALTVTRLGKIETETTSVGDPYAQLQYAQVIKADQPMLVAKSNNGTRLTRIMQFNPDLNTLLIRSDSIPSSYGGFAGYFNYLVEPSYDRNEIWLSSGLSGGLHNLVNINSTSFISTFMNFEQRHLLANHYTKAMTRDSGGRLILGHQYLENQFNNALVTIFDSAIPLAETPDNPGKGLSYQDSNAYLSINDTAQRLKLSEKFTFEAWIFPRPSVNSAHYAQVLFSRFAEGLGRRYSFQLSHNPITSRYKLAMAVPGSGASASSQELIPPNYWTHVAFIRDENRIKAYINGRLVIDSVVTVGDTSDLNQALTTLGANRTNTLTNNNFNGILDDVRVSNTARDVSALWNSGAYYQPLASDAATLALWKMNENYADKGPFNFTSNPVGNLQFVTGVVPSPDLSQLCIESGGRWTEFPNACADLCSGGAEIRCPDVITKSCECGTDMCWTGSDCVVESKR